MSTTPAAAETRHFTMHPKLLFDVIQRQAGTLSKAILEAVMNSADAGATRCEITLSATGVTVVDDGKGFRSREEVVKFFEVFGQPHSESEGKRYGTFRMGRGQCFSFGRNRWRTGTFRMDVDIKNRGLEYELLSNEEPAPGCRIDIEFYEILRPTTVIDLSRDFERLVRYSPMPVILNGKTLSEPAGETKWPLETDEAWLKVDVGGSNGLKVYNLGIHVADLSSYTWGCSGTIVSKQQLRVNFARNDIMADDPVWRKIAAVVRKQVNDGAGKKRLSSSERAVLFRRMLAQEVDWRDYRSTKFFTDCTGRGWSIDQLERNSRVFGANGNEGVYTFAPRNSSDGDRLMQHGLAFVLDESMLEIVGSRTPKHFFKDALPHYAEHRQQWQDAGLLGHRYVPLEQMAKQLKNDRYTLVPEKDWSDRERLILSEIEGACYRITSRLRELGVEAEHRRLVLGMAPHARGWTDGSTYIAINRDELKAVRPTTEGFLPLAALLLHEYCHNSADVGDHVHDEAFYRLYHDASEKLGEVAAAMAGHYLRRLRKKSGEMPAAVLRAAALQTEATTLDAAYEAMSEHHAARRERVRQAVSDALEPKVPGGEPMEARACPPANP